MSTAKNNPSPDLEFHNIAHEERHLMEMAQVPVVTVSATFKEELLKEFGERASSEIPEVTFSRAHYSMANAIVIAATKLKKTFWMIDPTNYVSARDWPKILFTEEMGRVIARNSLLKELKDMVDTRARNQLPLTAAIREPLTYVTGRVERPIISLHYEAGNILVENGKSVLQVVTDPQVRPQYVTHAKNPKLSWAVFDEKTKAELIEVAYLHGAEVAENRITVTGCPVDPRITGGFATSPTAYRRRPLRLAVTTGGLGTNKVEIEALLDRVTPLIRNHTIQIAAYAGVHDDFLDMFERYAHTHRIAIGADVDKDAAFRIFKGGDIVSANELLLQHIFPWADGFVTKPSGDMAYEAVAAGCFLLTLTPWGTWEENIRQYFEEKRISIRVRANDFAPQLIALMTLPVENGKPWIELALERAARLQEPLSRGAGNIVKLHEKLCKR